MPAAVPADGQASCKTTDLCSTKAADPLSDPLQNHADEAKAPTSQQSQEEAAAALATSGERDKTAGEAGASTGQSGAAQMGAADSPEGAPSDEATAAVRCKLAAALGRQALQQAPCFLYSDANRWTLSRTICLPTCVQQHSLCWRVDGGAVSFTGLTLATLWACIDCSLAGMPGANSSFTDQPTTHPLLRPLTPGRTE